MVFEWYDEEASETVYIHTAYANSPDGTVDFTLDPPEETDQDDAPVFLYTGQYEDDDPNENSNPGDYVWTFTDYDPAQEPEEDGEVAEPPELDPLAAAGLPDEAVRQITDLRTYIVGNQDASDQTITNPNELIGTNHGADGYTVTSGLEAASLPDPVYAEGDSDLDCCRITCQTAANDAAISFDADELESKILASIDDGSTYTLSFDIRMSNPAATGAITLGDLLTFDAFDPDDYLIVEDDPPDEEEEAEEEEAEGDEMAEDDSGSEVDDDEEPPEPGPVDITDEWVHFVAYAVVDPNGTGGDTLTIPVTMAAGDTLDIVNLKIEAGDLATPWKPSVIEAQAAADNALSMARATNKHFFYASSSGAHITTVENGPNSGKNVLIDSNGLYVRNNTDNLAEFTANSAVIGQSSAAHASMSSSGLQVYKSDGTTQIANIGYGPGKNSGGTTSNAPYYTLGVRTGSVGNYSTEEGYSNEASGYTSHAEGQQTTASGAFSHAEGTGTTASNTDSHAEGAFTTASGAISHAEGNFTIASGFASHASGSYTEAASDYQTAIGKHNIVDSSDTYAFIIGNGSYNDRSNALAVKWNGEIIAVNGAVYEYPYKNETVTETALVGYGYAAANATPNVYNYYFNVPLPKKIADGSTVTVTAIKGSIRSVGGLVVANNTDILTNVAEATRANNGFLRLNIQNLSANWSANTPASIYINSITFTVS